MILIAIVDTGALVASANRADPYNGACLESFDIQAPIAAEWQRIAELVEEYQDFPLGGTDASVAALAERFETELIISLDRKHFSVVRTGDGRPFRLLP